ncbi:MAG: AtpZ/AtpI family protein, partial [Bradymonadaceae bacterium]
MTSDESTDTTSDDESGDDGPSDWAQAGMVGAIGFEFVGFIAVGILVGRWIDQQLGIEPLGLLVGLLVAIVAA